MRKTFMPLALVFSGLFLFSSCQKVSEPLTDIEKDYQFYPLEIGKYIVYDVDSLIYDDFLKTIIPIKSQLRYTVVDTFRDNSNELAYVVNIQVRKEETQPYKPQDVIYVSRYGNKLVVTQQNRKFIKLTFPIENEKNWNGNVMIPLDDERNEEYINDKWNYVYKNLGESFNTGVRLYQNTVTVDEIDDQLNNPDEDSTVYSYRNYAQEIYANGIGLIHRERIYWTFQPKSPDGQSGGRGYRKGFSVTMNAVDHN